MMYNPWKMSLALALWGSACAWAASPTSAPAAAPATVAAQQTFVCKDGSKISAPTSQGACRGHQGIDTDATNKARAAPAPSAKKAAAAGAAPTPAAQSDKAGKATPAPGGGPGKVWANAASKVYHCPGDRYYGTTKAGSYMTEADAKNQGMHPARNKACS